MGSDTAHAARLDRTERARSRGVLVLIPRPGELDEAFNAMSADLGWPKLASCTAMQHPVRANRKARLCDAGAFNLCKPSTGRNPMGLGPDARC